MAITYHVKTRLILLLGIVCLLFTKMYGQFIVYQDEQGLVLTTVDSYATGKQYATTASHTRTNCLGSPFLTFPVWQEGSVQLDNSGREINCQLAYNLFSNEVLCRFTGDSAVKIITPEFFTINDTRFVRLQNSLAGIDYRTYFSLLHNGPTKLWTSLSSQLEGLNSADSEKIRRHRDLTIQAVYRTKQKYYIQKENGTLVPINLTKKSLLDAFPDQSVVLDSKIPPRQLTTNNVIDVINSYDSLAVIERETLTHLSKEERFRRNLQTSITYPGWVGKQGIYGRVYAGFEVDSLGKIKNIVILSPENIGFGFAEAAKKALEKLSDAPLPSCGKYALPVTFTFTNSRETAGPHVPVNRLSDNRLSNRTLLEEVVIPFVMNQPIVTSREVWGYYQ